MGFGYLQYCREMGWRQVEFFIKFLAYLMIFQSEAQQRCCRTFKNHQIRQKFSKPWRKTSFSLTSIHFSADSGYVPENRIVCTHSTTTWVCLSENWITTYNVKITASDFIDMSILIVWYRWNLDPDKMIWKT